MAEWLASHHSKRKRSEQQHYGNASASSDNDWSKYEHHSSAYRQPPRPRLVSSSLQSNAPPASGTSSSGVLQHSLRNDATVGSSSLFSPNCASAQSNQNASANNNPNNDFLPEQLVQSYLNNKMNNQQTASSPKVTLPPEECQSLNPEQRKVVELVLSGQSVFFTGPAGSGKTHVLSSILRWNEQVRKKD